MTELKRREGENEEQYLWRVGQLVDSGLFKNWDEIAEDINEEWRDDESEYRSSSAYRKPYQYAKRFYEAGVFSRFDEADYAESLNSQKRELEKAKVAYRDERNGWNKQNRIEARVEATLDNLERELRTIGESTFIVDNNRICGGNGDNSLIVMLSDLHTGQTFDSPFGQYNTDILKDRLAQLLNKTIEIGRRHNSVMVNIVLLGDQISGNIHNTIQVSNRENVIEQIKIAAEVITWFCVELSKAFGYVHVYECAGNHSRLIGNKELAVHDERLDNLITWIVKQMTAHIDSIKVHNDDETRIDSGISMFELYGKEYVAVHGDYDNLTKTGVGNLSMMLGKIPYAIMNGHNHFPMNTDINGVKIIQGGSMAGSGDDYTIEKRLSGKPNQTVLVCDDSGIDCIYNIELK